MNTAVPAEEAARIRERHLEGERERAFWKQHRAELRMTYPDKVVAVKDGEVVAVADSLFDLADLLESQGLTPAQTWIEHLNTEPRRLTL